jgi:transglutaminase-like putative cysteine protease
MLFEIEHLTLYRYSVPVRLGEHLLRFLPAHNALQRPLRCRLDIDPLPLRSEEATDAWGNRIQRVWFRGETEHLKIRADLAVETREPGIPYPAPAPPLLLDYGPETPGLAPYLGSLEDPVELGPFLAPLLTSGGDALDFLDGLNHAVRGLYHSGVRLEGPPRSPAETLRRGEGVCRDLTVLFMAACRQAGLAARFVSGYQRGDGTRQQRYLHAWPEVYLPGLGWRGYDPTHGTAAGSDHLAIAAAPEAGAANPLEGGYSFQGTHLTSTLETEIRVTTR